MMFVRSGMKNTDESLVLEKLNRILDSESVAHDPVELALRAAAAAPQECARSGDGGIVRMMRDRVYLTQRQLAELAGLPHSKIARIEAGQDVRLSTLRRYFAGCGCELLLLPRSSMNARELFERKMQLEREGLIQNRRRYSRR